MADIAVATDGSVIVKIRDADHSGLAQWKVTGPDALAPVRSDMREANVPRID